MQSIPSIRSSITRAAVVIFVATVPLMLSACGTAVGAGAGGLAGSQFGHGSGKTAATIGGVVAGGVLGHAVTGD